MEQLPTEREEGTAEHDRAHVRYGGVMYAIGFISCMIALLAPLLILLFPHSNILNPNLVFGAIFSGQSPAEIWMTAGVDFRQGNFWRLLRDNLFTPDGFAIFGIALGCSSAFLALCTAAWSYAKGKKWFFLGVVLFNQLLMALAMTGLINMAG